MWFDKTVSDFNGSISQNIKDVASIGNAFTSNYLVSFYPVNGVH